MRNNEIAFLEKVFLRPAEPDKPLRGVELFNLNLIRDLTKSGHGVFLPLHRSWEPIVRRFADNGLETHHVKPLGIPTLTCLSAGFAIVGEARRHGVFPTLFIANDVNGLIPANILFQMLHPGKNTVLMAHKLPYGRFLASVTKLRGSIVGVCTAIADEFRKYGTTASVYADYGIANAADFFPAADRASRTKETVDFCLLGDMGSSWKGADTAIEAFNLLPPELKSRARLHIKAFTSKRDIPVDGIIQHPWTAPSQIPDFLREMDVMLAPSRNNDKTGRLMETFSQTTVQGMLTALPVIHTSIPPLAEKFDTGGGITANSPSEFADAMTKLILDSKLRCKLGEEARKTALERYVWNTDRFYDRYLATQ